MKFWSVTVQMLAANKQYFSAALYIVMWRLVLTFEGLDEIL